MQKKRRRESKPVINEKSAIQKPTLIKKGRKKRLRKTKDVTFNLPAKPPPPYDKSKEPISFYMPGEKVCMPEPPKSDWSWKPKDCPIFLKELGIHPGIPPYDFKPASLLCWTPTPLNPAVKAWLTQHSKVA